MKTFYYEGNRESDDYTLISTSGTSTDQICNLSRTIRMCNSPHIKLREEQENERPFTDRIAFFLRTIEGNEIVINTHREPDNKQSLFYADLEQSVEGATLNDCVLLSARDVLRAVFPSYDLPVLGINASPTPYGSCIIENKEVHVFQLVVNSRALKDLADGYEYAKATDLKDTRDFHIIYRNFAFTKEENKDA